MDNNSYERLAHRLNDLPSGYPSTEDGAELRILEKLFTPEEADLAAELTLTKENPDGLAERLGRDPQDVRMLLRGMAKRGLIVAGRTDDGLGYGLMPFVVGIYEFQAGTIDEELATLVEAYYQQALGETLSVNPSFHRVLPVQESVPIDIDVRPYENASEIVEQSQAWGVLDCVCRTQKELIGDPCEHPKDVCMVLSEVPGAFDNSTAIQKLDKDGAHATLKKAADAGLVHSVSNNQEGHWYICNCCTCSCGILRGIAEFGIANVVARSPFVTVFDRELCFSCDLCADACQFEALTYEIVPSIDENRCVGCGLCVIACPEGAFTMTRRSDEKIEPIPVTHTDWRMARAAARDLDFDDVR